MILAIATPRASGAELLPPSQKATVIALPGCEGGRATQAIYNPCADQMAIYDAGLAEAKAAGKSLAIVFGATWCPSCRSLKTVMPSAAWFAERNLGQRVHVVEIAISTLHAGKVTPVPSGVAVLDRLLAVRSDVKSRAVPFLGAVDAATGRVYLRNLDDLEPRQGGGWSVSELARVADEADIEVRGGIKAASEPGWLMRKWQRLVR
jgi:thiol-disulfide isomerase/thioredoxin